MRRPSSARSSPSSSSTARLHRDVERRGDLVADQQLGSRGERAGDRDALALAAGELARVAPAGAGRQAHALQQRARLALSARACPRPRSWRAGRADDRRRPVARVERVVRVLEDDLHAPALLRAARRPARDASGEPSSAIVPPSGACSPRRSGRSSSCRCPTRRPAPRTRPRPTRTRRPARRPRCRRAAVCRRKPSTLEQRRGVAASTARPSGRLDGGRGVRCHSKQRTRGRSAIGVERRQRGVAAGDLRGQRGANAQPGGRSPTPPRPPGCRAADAASRGRGSPTPGRACTDAWARA